MFEISAYFKGFYIFTVFALTALWLTNYKFKNDVYYNS
ncbi:MAG: hypothetical protein JWP44_2556 [Mucilaginibacter sp.]|nr:hypothetical protein [Mucilaginibacter sp.]